jgi:hypothetical protein
MCLYFIANRYCSRFRLPFQRSSSILLKSRFRVQLPLADFQVKMSTKRTQPDWATPNNENQAKLHLFNSLTRSKELFVPQNGNKVNNPKILLFSGFDFLLSRHFIPGASFYNRGSVGISYFLMLEYLEKLKKNLSVSSLTGFILLFHFRSPGITAARLFTMPLIWDTQGTISPLTS